MLPCVGALLCNRVFFGPYSVLKNSQIPSPLAFTCAVAYIVLSDALEAVEQRLNTSSLTSTAHGKSQILFAEQG